jgi:UDP-N-acetylglucosamine transferase subunit ALG13
MEALCKRARVVISHAGSGSILTALRHNKPLIVMPRRHKYGEAIDDHQLELADALSQAGALLAAYETGELSTRLRAAESFMPRVPNSSRDGLIEALRQAVQEGKDRRCACA